jgi:tRNA 2-selenouridine synthase
MQWDDWFGLQHVPVIDVRSEAEFEQGHFPGAINLPLFANQERHQVGKIYKQQGRQEAILKGLEFVGSKMHKLAQTALQIQQNHQLRLYCWRGGMRSQSMAWLFEQVGIQSSPLIGGYKTFRQWVLNQFSKKYHLKIVGGETGSRKTEVLHALQGLGEQIIDLEGFASHKGSAFGALEGLPQPTTEQFENNLALWLCQLDSERCIWVEDESSLIGTVHLPNELFKQIQQAPLYCLKVPKNQRVIHLVQSYGHFSKAQLAFAIQRIEKRIGKVVMQQALSALQEGDLAQVASLALTYYDKAYAAQLAKRTSPIYPLAVETSLAPWQVAQMLRELPA